MLRMRFSWCEFDARGAYVKYVVRVIAVGLVLAGTSSAEEGISFDVVSIKRNSANRFVAGPDGPGTYWLSNGTAADMVLRGYPTDTPMVNVPDWAMSERYDVLAKGKPRATIGEQRQMWRTLLAERLNLRVHYERRQHRGYRLVFARADRRLGPGIRVSELDCTGQPPFPGLGAIRAFERAEQFAVARCGFMMVRTDAGPTQVSGGASMDSLARLLAGFVQQPVIDATGLQGNYAVALALAPGPAVSGGPGNDGLSVFTAVQEQLGLKLQAGDITVEALVIDHIERPSDN